MVVSVPHTGFVPGQIIPLTLELDNASKVGIRKVQIMLEKVMLKRIKYISVFKHLIKITNVLHF